MDQKSRYQEYSIEAERTDKILDCLNRIRWEQDPTLAYRFSCAHGICGSDAMVINGRIALACQSLIGDYKTSNNFVIEPLPLFTVVKDPQAYLSYSDHAVEFYKFFIDGVFKSFTIFIVSLIGAGQILVGIFLLRKGKLFLLGILGGIIFLIAIAPLGIGSAFPSTLLMALSLILLYRRYKKV